MDRVKLYPQERLDLDDVRALQALSYDYTQEELGAVLGPARGVLSVPRVIVVENGGAPYMTLSPFAFVTSTPVADSGAVLPASVTEYAQHKSVVANYSASEESSAQISLDIARAYYQDSAGSWYLWARPRALGHRHRDPPQVGRGERRGGHVFGRDAREPTRGVKATGGRARV